jgi:methionyl-tRNA formyltransferase
MRISILSSDPRHPVFGKLREWSEVRARDHEVELVTTPDALGGGDLLFLIVCRQLIGPEIRCRYRHTLVVHASRLPHGRGWSPHIWQVLEGCNAIPVSLLEAVDKLDSGAIWAERVITLEGHELYDEINERLFAVTTELMDFAILNDGRIVPRPQGSATPTYYRKRTPEDSRLDPAKTLAEQFDLLRVADPERFPCFFEIRGRRYRVLLRKD